jgi:hypothetical protein
VGGGRLFLSRHAEGGPPSSTRGDDCRLTCAWICRPAGAASGGMPKGSHLSCVRRRRAAA